MNANGFINVFFLLLPFFVDDLHKYWKSYIEKLPKNQNEHLIKNGESKKQECSSSKLSKPYIKKVNSSLIGKLGRIKWSVELLQF
jgi:hypothetical protein